MYITPKAVTFPEKNELPRVGMYSTCTCTCMHVLLYILYLYMYIALLCCLFNLACIFLPSFSSLIIKNIYKHDLYTCIYMNIHVYTV